MSLLTNPFNKNSHILAQIYFVSLKIILDQTLKAFNSKFELHWKDQKSSYQVRQVLAHFCKFVKLILG